MTERRASHRPMDGICSRRNAFVWVTLLAITGIFVITLAGSIVTTRPRTPSISVIIDDDPALRFVYSLFVGVLAISRTGLVYTSTFYVIPKAGWWINTFLPNFSAACGGAQLICFTLVAAFSVTLDPTYHYVAAAGTVVFGFVCEIILWYRRYLRVTTTTDENWELVYINAIVFLFMYVSLFTFAGITWTDSYNELKMDMAIAEWIGYYLVAYINIFRLYDVDAHEKEERLQATDVERCAHMLIYALEENDMDSTWVLRALDSKTRGLYPIAVSATEGMRNRYKRVVNHGSSVRDDHSNAYW